MLEVKIQAAGMNALNLALMANIERSFREAEGAPILLTGEGRAFSAGLNLKELLSLDVDGMTAFLEQLIATCRAIFEHPGPVVAAVNGHAIAGGCILALCADYRVMTSFPRARVGLNEVALGVCFPPPVLRLITHQLSPRARDEVVLGAALHGPEACARLGLANELSEDSVARGRVVLEGLASHPPVAYAAAKEGLRAGVMDSSDAEMAAFRERYVPVWASDSVRARMRAAVGG